MDDLISRKAAIEALQNHYEAGNPFVGRNTTIDECVDALHELPSAQGWTPVIEGLPANHGQVWCTYADGTMGLCHFDAQEKIFVSGFGVVAWMPKPAPYQGKEREAKK